MAGNTKLIGFVSGGQIQLERWGKRENVDVGEEAVKAITHACVHELPLKPPDREVNKKLLVGYDYMAGCIRAALSVEAAEETVGALRTLDLGPSGDGMERLTDWILSFESALELYKRHHDRKEPGIE